MPWQLICSAFGFFYSISMKLSSVATLRMKLKRVPERRASFLMILDSSM